MPIHSCIAESFPNGLWLTYHQNLLNRTAPTVQTAAHHRSLYANQYRRTQHGQADEVIDWSLPVTQLTEMLRGHYPRITSLTFGDRKNQPLLLKGTAADFVAFAKRIREAFPNVHCFDLHVRLRDNNGQQLSVLPFFDHFRVPMNFYFGLDTGTGMISEQELLPLLSDGCLYRGVLLIVGNPLTVEQCLELARPASGGMNNDTLCRLGLTLDVEMDVDKAYDHPANRLKLADTAPFEEVAAIKAQMSITIEAGAVQSAKKLANLLFHFRNLEHVYIRGENVGSAFVKALLTEILEIRRHKRYKPENREGLSGSKRLVFRFLDVAEVKLSKDCQQSVLEFIDGWTDCPVYFHFQGVVEVGDPAFRPTVDQFDRAHKFKSAAKAAVFDLNLGEPNNQHFEMLHKATTSNLTSAKKEDFCPGCDYDKIEVALAHELLSLYPLMIRPLLLSPGPEKKYKKARREEKCCMPEGFIPFEHYSS